MSKLKIFVSLHKKADVLHTGVFEPIQVGCALPGRKTLKGMLHDNEGENISAWNETYCELTAQYWAWKNADLDYYGFCHYRRYFNFTDKIFEEDSYGNIIERYLDDATVKKYGLEDDRIQALVQKYDVLVTERKDLRILASEGKTPIEQYQAADKLHFKDFELMLDIIHDKYSDYAKAADTFANGNYACFCNMYILKKEYFFEYCSFMFGVLAEFDKRSDMTHYSTEARRTPGHLSERLFNIYLLYLLKKNPNLKVKELQCVLIEHTDPQEAQLKPAFEDAVPVALAANDNYVPMFATCLRSMLSHFSTEKKYDIVLISSDITRENRETLLGMVQPYDNVSLRFYDPGRLLENYKLKGNAHISVETYYRFLIQYILPDYDKVIYIDCDLIVNEDLAKLYQIELGTNLLGAVRDVDFLGQINGANPDTPKYIKTKFRMKDPYQYFQAGVLLFNEKEMRKAYSLDQWLTFASKPYLYNDQDVLNLYCEGKVIFLNMSWNTVTDCDHYRISHVVVYAPDSVQKEYAEARKHPYIVHYAGYMKPWYRPSEDFAKLFWTTARETPYYEELVFRLADGIANWQICEAKKSLQNTKEKKRTQWVNKIFPKGTERRKKLDQVYAKLFTTSDRTDGGSK